MNSKNTGAINSGLSALPGFQGTGNVIPGVLIGLVSNNKDPDGLGRVKVVFPILGVDPESKNSKQVGVESDWAPVATFYAGSKRGGYFLPEIDDEVLVAFYLGDINRPFVMGALWNGKDRPIQKNEDGKNDIKQITTRSGLTIRFSDKQGDESIRIYDEENKEEIKISKKDKRITIQSEKEILVESPKGVINIQAKDINIKASSALKMEGGTVSIDSKGALNANGGSVNVKSKGLVGVKGSTINLN